MRFCGTTFPASVNRPSNHINVRERVMFTQAILFHSDRAPLRLACRRLGVSEDQAWMVGDGYHDIDAGIAAGIKTVWVSHGKVKPFPAEPWRTVRDLLGLTELVRSCLISR